MIKTREDRKEQSIGIVSGILTSIPAGSREKVSVVYEQRVRGLDRYVIRVHTNRTPGRDGGSPETPESPTT
jgi:hypothetical protein